METGASLSKSLATATPYNHSVHRDPLRHFLLSAGNACGRGIGLFTERDTILGFVYT